MRVFVDTSAFLAVLDADDGYHDHAKETWVDLVTQDTRLICTSYVLVETFALVQNRLGMQAVRVFQEDILPIVNIAWVDEVCHRAGVSALLTTGQRQLSLVDVSVSRQCVNSVWIRLSSLIATLKNKVSMSFPDTRILSSCAEGYN